MRMIVLNRIFVVACMIVSLCNSLMPNNYNFELNDKNFIFLNKNDKKNLSYITNRKISKSLHLSLVNNELSAISEILSTHSIFTSIFLSSLELSQQSQEIDATITSYVPPEVTSEIWLVK